MTSGKRFWASATIAALLVPATSLAVSFDCTKAQSFREKAVCSNPDLGGLDDLLGSAYQEATRTTEDKQGLVASQRRWMAEANRCTTEDCIAEAYRSRISELDGAEEGDTDNVEEPDDEQPDEQPSPVGNASRIQGVDRHREEQEELNRQVEDGIREAREADEKAREAQRLQDAKAVEEAKAQALAGRANLAAHSGEEFCEIVRKSPALNRYADVFDQWRLSVGSGYINFSSSVGLDSSDRLLAKWVSEKFRAAYPDFDTSRLRERSEELIGWLAWCAWQLRDDKLAVVFDPDRKTGKFWTDASSQAEKYEAKAAAPKTRTIDSSGNVSEVGAEAGSPFVPGTSGLDLASLAGGCGYPCSLEPRRVSGVLALLFVDGEKVLAQVSQEQVAKLEGEIAAKRKAEGDEKVAAAKQEEERQQQAAKDLASLLKLYSHYAELFPSEKSDCEQDMKAVVAQEIEAAKGQIKQAATVSQQEALTKQVEDVENKADLGARAGCFVKFITEVEIILTGTSMLNGYDLLIAHVAEAQLTDAGKTQVADGLKLPYSEWVQQRVEKGVGDPQVEATHGRTTAMVRSVAFQDRNSKAAAAMASSSSEFGCKVDGGKFSCDP